MYSGVNLIGRWSVFVGTVHSTSASRLEVSLSAGTGIGSAVDGCRTTCRGLGDDMLRS
jgi:hypothetical protein